MDYLLRELPHTPSAVEPAKVKAARLSMPDSQNYPLYELCRSTSHNPRREIRLPHTKPRPIASGFCDFDLWLPKLSLTA